MTTPGTPFGLGRMLADTWRLFLPAGIVLMAVALLAGLLSSGGAPAIIFAIAVLVTLVGVAGLVIRLATRARDAVEDMLDGDDTPGPSGPAGPGGPKI